MPHREHKVSFIHGDVVETDFTSATCIFVYLVPEGLRRIEKKLREFLKGGGRIVSYMFSLPNLSPVAAESTKGGCKVMLYDHSSMLEG